MATTVVVNFIAAEGKNKLLAESLTEIVEIVRGYHTCHKATLFVSEQSRDKMMIIEEWESSDEHQKFYAELRANGAFDQVAKLFSDFSFNYFEKEDDKN